MTTNNYEEEIRRECHGRTIAISRKVDRITDGVSDCLYLVQSENNHENYYFVRYEDSYEWCSCKDYESNRSEKCKHLYAVKYAIKLGIFKDNKYASKLSTSIEQQKNEDNEIKIPTQKMTITITDSRNKQLPYELDDYNF